MSILPQIILPIVAGGLLTKMIGIWMAMRLGRLTRGTIETPDEWSFASKEGNSKSQAWLKTVSESANTDWSGKARRALRVQQFGMFVFFAGWVVAMLAIVFGW